MTTQEKIGKTEEEIRKALEEQKNNKGKLSPEEAARIQSTDLPSGDPGRGPVER